MFEVRALTAKVGHACYILFRSATTILKIQPRNIIKTIKIAPEALINEKTHEKWRHLLKQNLRPTYVGKL